MFLLLISLVIIFTISLLIVLPNHIFYTKIQETNNIKKIAKKLRKNSKEATLKSVYNFVTNNFTNEKYGFLLYFPKLFYHDVEKLLKKKQFAQCTLQNLVLVTLLLNTGQFKEKDIRRKWTIVNFFVLHQYILIKINNSIYRVDPLWKILGIQ